MPSPKERILVAEYDLMVADLITRQVLIPQGYDVEIVKDGAAALKQATSFSPDVIIANMELPGLSGKDLMVALSSQDFNAPVIMIAPKGKEKDVIQAFRLGASDYISSPVREAEVLSAVERALEQVRARRERQRLARELERTNKQLQKRVNELTTIFRIGKAVTSVTSQDKLFEEIIAGALNITEADIGWLLIYDEEREDYKLVAHQGLPKSLAANLNKSWDDGLSSLVAKSGETITIRGSALEKFPISAMGKTALVVPINVKGQTIAILAVMRKKDDQFGTSDQAMLEAVGDYASISLINARLFQALDSRAANLEIAMDMAKENQRAKDDIIQYLGQEFQVPLSAAKQDLTNYLDSENGKLNKEQIDLLQDIQKKIERAGEVVEGMVMIESLSAPKELTKVNLCDLAIDLVEQFRDSAMENGVSLAVKLPSEPQYAYADTHQIEMVLAALLSNAVKFSHPGGEVLVDVFAANGLSQISVQDHGVGISNRNADHIFERFYKVKESDAGLGIGLTIVREIVTAHGGKIWLDSKPDAGSTFHFTLKPPE